MLIYLASVDTGYQRVIVRKTPRGIHAWLILRIESPLLHYEHLNHHFSNQKKIHSTLQKAHKYTHKNSDKDLIYIPGFDESGEDEQDFIDHHILYS